MAEPKTPAGAVTHLTSPPKVHMRRHTKLTPQLTKAYPHHEACGPLPGPSHPPMGSHQGKAVNASDQPVPSDSNPLALHKILAGA